MNKNRSCKKCLRTEKKCHTQLGPAACFFFIYLFWFVWYCICLAFILTLTLIIVPRTSMVLWCQLQHTVTQIISSLTVPINR